MVEVKPDPALRTCMAKVKRQPVKNENDVAELITLFKQRGDDCASKLAATWRSIDDANARIAAFNKAQEGTPPK
jgi:hypothetical protein